MFASFRFAMTWVHTWFGLVLGYVLLVCFFFGTLSVFAREIDRWAIPATRFAAQPMPSFDSVLRPAFEAIRPTPAEAGADAGRFARVLEWNVSVSHRDPVLVLSVGYEGGGGADSHDGPWIDRLVDPRTGQPLPGDRLKIGSDFFYPMHLHLHWHWLDLGYWLIGLGALTMLVALVSGVLIHRRIFREFFTFRPGKALSRSVLDLHDLTGVVALPFHFFFALTGLMIFASLYFPVASTQLAALHDRHEARFAQQTRLPLERAGVPAPLASVDAMADAARRRWAELGAAGDVGLIAVRHVGDANGYVIIGRANDDRIVPGPANGIYFKADTGEVLYESPPRSAVARVHEYLAGLHIVPFRHWLLRGLYGVGGLSGCVCIATGFLFFVDKRKRQHARRGGHGIRIVDGLAVAAVIGAPLAAAGMLVANRLLPDALPSGWPARGDLERLAFWACWAMSSIHALIRSAPVRLGHRNPAWAEQCAALAVLAASAALLNGITTGDHLLATLRGGDWPVAGVDLTLLAIAALAALATRRLARHRPVRH